MMELRAKVIVEGLRSKDIIKEIFNLSNFETDIYFFLLNGIYLLKDIINHFDKSKSSIQRAINSLMKKKLVERVAINAEGGSLRYGYRAVSLDALKERIKELLRNWYAKIMEATKSLEQGKMSP
ncbi:MAG: helix-turn-helix domain-containing protein [Candidatus Baldrarchaeia archaeon]